MQFGTDKDRVVGCSSEYEKAAFGVILPDDRSQAITVTGVEPIDPQNLDLGDISLMPQKKNLRLLLGHYPPTEQFPSQWPKARPALGVEIAPDDIVDLVLEVRKLDVEDEAGLSGVVIAYDSNGRSYEARTSLGLRLNPTKGC